jgi:hypothetical protein
MLRDVLLSLVKLMFGGCGGSQEDLLAIQAACLKHIVLTVPDLVQAENRLRKNLSVVGYLFWMMGEVFFLPVFQVPTDLLDSRFGDLVTFWCGSGPADSYL